MSKYISGTFSANGDSSEIILKEGTVMLGSSGGADFGSGTVTVQIIGPDGETYSSATTYTAADVDKIELGSHERVKLNLSGSTSPDLDYCVSEKHMTQRNH